MGMIVGDRVPFTHCGIDAGENQHPVRRSPSLSGPSACYVAQIRRGMSASDKFTNQKQSARLLSRKIIEGFARKSGSRSTGGRTPHHDSHDKLLPCTSQGSRDNGEERLLCHHSAASGASIPRVAVGKECCQKLLESPHPIHPTYVCRHILLATSPFKGPS